MNIIRFNNSQSSGLGLCPFREFSIYLGYRFFEFVQLSDSIDFHPLNFYLTLIEIMNKKRINQMSDLGSIIQKIECKDSRYF